MIPDTCGISTAYLKSLKVIARGSKGITIPFFLLLSPSSGLPIPGDFNLDDMLFGASVLVSALVGLNALEDTRSSNRKMTS